MVKDSNLLYQKALDLIKERQVELTDIAELVMFLQQSYVQDLTIEICLEHVNAVLKKREVQNAIITGIQLDILAEQNLLMQPLQDIIAEDEGLYGIDEIMALSIVNVYGSIGFTNFGYIDKVKPGILKKLNDHNSGEIHTFLDDIIGAIAASAASRLAHADPSKSDITH
ncbi:MAG: phosphatidylglycerophosphatase A [Carnobacterium sp.]|jgi:phosphatidylglycerophosphatase A|uniref:Phosphatidylglycerophosphatase A n=3 Tax=Carnobacterium TaxID=2747 RepID=A0AAW9JU88_CARML|nr:phosphatidylglycerophosphatase A [Carnobacterium maltaromaticum]AOA01429.1 phosphatidylglycerophosphatase A [Carnobacterium maltaromaticum]KRN60349.1 phosphatidylglycerophosphatase A [Carnobacterium maltaromaticum DSM 20342]KRN73858.1 phosphatidylglycerophosphatase A [Carnobacterium maltaromaticum]KRN85174.1 phosphatidylglycerophosphatase A [Carnobacterium maltaromaticum]MBC9808255.1 phosphatidylglycerophosphatase A [Carnobacterium maltaromaticum]